MDEETASGEDDPDSVLGGDVEADRGDPDALLVLPDALRGEFKDPLGPVVTDAEDVIARAAGPIVAVGDVVTHHLRQAGRDPDVALVDGRTERRAVDDEVRASLGDLAPDVRNPPATLTEDLLVALRAALDAEEPTEVVVDGEEDLATLPAVLAAPTGATVVYGQPGEGMVVIRVDEESRARCGELFDRLDGDSARGRAILRAENA